MTNLITKTEKIGMEGGSGVAFWLKEMRGDNKRAADSNDSLIGKIYNSNVEWLTKIAANSLRTADNTGAIKDDISGGVSINQPITVNVASGVASAQSIGSSVTSGIRGALTSNNTQILNMFKDALSKNTSNVRGAIKDAVTA